MVEMKMMNVFVLLVLLLLGLFKFTEAKMWDLKNDFNTCPSCNPHGPWLYGPQGTPYAYKRSGDRYWHTAQGNIDVHPVPGIYCPAVSSSTTCGGHPGLQKIAATIRWTNPLPVSASFTFYISSAMGGGESVGIIDVTTSYGLYMANRQLGVWYTDSRQLTVAPGAYHEFSITAANTDGSNNYDTTFWTIRVSTPAIQMGATKKDVTCYGGSDGSISISASGGAPPFTYSIDGTNYGSSSSFANLRAGPYTAYSRDQAGDVNTVAINIDQPTELGYTIKSSVNPKCKGAATGSLELTPTGGYATGYQISINGGTVYASSPYSFTGLSAQKYSVYIKDSTCTSKAYSITLTDPDILQVSAIKYDPLCRDGSDGSFTVQATGGIGPYTYSLAGSAYSSTATLGSQKFGIYEFYAQDANNCFSSKGSVTLNNPDAVVATITNFQNPTCNGYSTGSLSFSATGGTGINFQFSVNNGEFSSTGSKGSLPADTYSIVAMDSNFCKSSPATGKLTNPTVVSVDVSVTNTTCFGGNNGGLLLSGKGGNTNSYTYTVNTVGSGATYSGAKAGKYDVVAYDANNCPSPITQSVIYQPDVVVASGSVTNPKCNGDSTGSLSLSAIGGTGAYQYSINGGTYGDSATRPSLPSGDYTIVAQDANKCKSDPIKRTLVYPDVVTVAVKGSSNPVCAGGSTGSLSLEARGGSNTGFVYIVNNKNYASSTVGSLSAGSYSITVVDSNQCVSPTPASALLIDPSVVTVSIVARNSSCIGSQSGSLTLSGSGGARGTYTFSVNNREFSSDTQIGSLGPGKYSVVAKDTSSCVSNPAEVTLVDPSGVRLDVTSTNPVCAGGLTGSLSFTVSGGSGQGYSFYVNESDLGASKTYSSLAANLYSVVAKDGQGCISNTVLKTLVDPPVVTVSIGVTKTTCYGGSNGELSLSPRGGNGLAYTFSLNGSTPLSDVTRKGLLAGVYSVKAFDGNNCPSALTLATIDQPTAVQAVAVASNPVCASGYSGSLTLSATGGTGAHKYSVNGDTFRDGNRVSLPAGTYNIVAQDINQCNSVVVSKTLVDPQVVSVSIVSKSNPVCTGGNTGSLGLKAEGGSGAGYLFIVNGKNYSSPSISLLEAGNYTVLAVDSRECVSPTSVTDSLVDPNAVALQVTPTNPTCYEGATGSLAFEATGGTGKYTFWVNGSDLGAGKTYTGLEASTYSVIAKDDAGCISNSVMKTLIDPLVVSLSIEVTNATCFESATGELSFSPSGGNGLDYTFAVNKNDPLPSRNRKGLLAGDYSVVAFDGNNCPSAASIAVIYEPTVVSAFATSTNPICASEATGSLSLSASGGTGGFLYSIDGSVFSADVYKTALFAGNYSIIAQDDNKCKSSAITKTLVNPEVVSISVPSSTNPICAGSNTGSLSLAASGGSDSGFVYNVNGKNYTSASISSLAAGVYSITVVDNNQCVSPISTSATLTDPDVVVLSVAARNSTCNGGNTGSLSLSATGGSRIYTYSVNNGAFSSQTLVDLLGPGEYTVVAKDNLGCLSAPVSVTLIDPDVVTLRVTPKNPLCTGSSTGSLSFEANGGRGRPYSFRVNGTIWGTVASSLAAGYYEIEAIDSEQCVSAPQYATLIDPAEFVVDVTVSNPKCYGSASGSLNFVPSGGTGDGYKFSVNGSTFSSNDKADDLVAGMYNVTAIDGNFCVASVIKILQDPLVVTVSAVSDDPLCYRSSTGKIQINSAGGTGVYTYLVNGVKYTTSAIDSLPAGSYEITATDSNECISPKSASTVLTDPTTVTVTVYATNSTCSSGTAGSLRFAADGGSGKGYTYYVNGVFFNTTTTLAELGPSEYSVYAQDSNLCPSIASNVTLSDPSAVSLRVNSTDPKCYNTATGALSFQASGGSGAGYTYSINQGVFNSEDKKESLSAGNYIVSAKDENGCISNTVNVHLKNPAELTVTAVAHPPACTASASGEILLGANGGTGEYTFSCNNSEFTGKIVYGSLGASTYSYAAMDANKCLVTGQIVLEDPESVTVEISSTNPTCYSFSTGSLALLGKGGNSSGYTYAVNSDDFSSENVIASLSAGTYFVVAKDSNQCPSANVSVTLIDPSEVEVNVTIVYPTCFGSSNGALDFVPYGGNSSSYSYQINGEDFGSNNMQGLSAGEYSIQAIDAVGCVSKMQTAVLVDPEELKLQVVPTNPSCFGTNTGSLSVMARGGTVQYNYFVNGEEVSEGNVPSLLSGNYTIEVRDTNKCTIQEAVVLSDPPKLEVEAASDAIAGTILLSASGGTTPYSFQLNAQSQQNGWFGPNLLTGNYNYTVVDAAGCMVSSELYLNIDECANGKHNCSQNAQCNDTISSFTCECNEGYIGDGYTCAPYCPNGCIAPTLCIAPDICSSRPMISAISSCPTVGGVVTITGVNFGNDKENTLVSIGQQDCAVITVSETEITCNMYAGQGTLLAVVVNSTGIWSLPGVTFSFNEPTVKSISTVPTSGGSITIEGENFGLNAALISISSLLTTCVDIKLVTSHTTLLCTIQKGTGTDIPLSIDVAGNVFNTKFSYQAPTIESVTQPSTDGGEITISGNNFGDDSNVIQVNVLDKTKREQKKCSNITVGDNSILCYLSSGTGKDHTLSVSVAGQSNIALFSYEGPKLDILNIAPLATTGGSITISGSNFGDSLEKARITIGDNIECSTKLVSQKRIECEIPAGVGANYAVSVFIDGQTTTSPNSFSYQGPTVTSVSAVSSKGGRITITGYNFGAQSSVVEVNINETILCNNITSQEIIIECDVPAGQGENLTLSLSVAGQSTHFSGFNYTFEQVVPTTGDNNNNNGNTNNNVDKSKFNWVPVVAGTVGGVAGLAAIVGVSAVVAKKLKQRQLERQQSSRQFLGGNNTKGSALYRDNEFMNPMYNDNNAL